MSLPYHLRPGTDLMSKQVIQDQEVINIITHHLTNTKNDYISSNNEWADGTRSDVVLEPKSNVLNLPPIIVEIQHRVSEDFIKRTIGYSLQAFKRYECGPVVLIICTSSLSTSLKDDCTVSKRAACFEIPCRFWAQECLIVCKESIQTDDTTTPLDPFVALGLFLSHGAQSLVGTPNSDDMTMKQLFKLAMDYYDSLLGSERHLIETLNEALEAQSQ
ncbi:hypothetical protein BJV82DRAFT_598083 [Fennellomyces sp. T-0311]|nr:hypothetical protein BJV82DRAFT_598083 [Fennellomyces sp. T-0311]